MDYPEHPLIPNLNDLDEEALRVKLSELNKKLAIAYRMGNHELCNQLRMSIGSYNTKYQEKLRKNQDGTNFDDIIDIS
jgi:hypothetical protein